MVMRPPKTSRQSAASQLTYEHHRREDADRQARHAHNRVRILEECDRCGKPMEPADMVVGDFESYHKGCAR